MKQLLTYFGLAYLISWIIWLPLYGHIFGLNNLPALPYQHAIGALGPLIAALITTFIFLEKDGIKKLLATFLQIKPLIYLAVALLSPFLLVFIASLISYFINKTPINFSALVTAKEFPQSNFITFFIYNLLFFGFGEEVGWRGFALPRLQNKMNAFFASIVLTLFWALWHLPLFFYRDGFTTMSTAGIFGWVFSLLTGSILLTWLYNSSKGSILMCAVFHTTIDIAFTADYADKNIASYLGVLITVWGILTIIIFKPKKLAW
jgi:uncharacterized protein